MADSTVWPSRETLSVMAFIMSKRDNLSQMKKFVVDSKASNDPPSLLAKNIQTWVEQSTDADTSKLSEPFASLMISALDQVDYRDIAVHVLELYG